MQDQIQQLKQIVTSENGFDREARQYVNDLEAEFKQAVEADKLREHPAIKPYLDFLFKEVVDCKEMLSGDPTLNDVARDRLFERIKQCKATLRAFGHNREDIEIRIKETLETAQKQMAA